jgi:hypothetical protein
MLIYKIYEFYLSQHHHRHHHHYRALDRIKTDGEELNKKNKSIEINEKEFVLARITIKALERYIIYVCVCIYIYMCVCMHVCIYSCICLYIYIYVYV